MRVLLTDGEGRKKNGNKPVLPPRQTVAWVSGNLQYELAISALMEQATRNWPLHRQPAQDERARGVAEILTCAFALQTNAFNRLYLSNGPLGDGEPRMSVRVKPNCGLSLPADGFAHIRPPDVLSG